MDQAGQSQTVQERSASVSARQAEAGNGSGASGLTPGQVVRGELVSSENGEVQIKL